MLVRVLGEAETKMGLDFMGERKRGRNWRKLAGGGDGQEQTVSDCSEVLRVPGRWVGSPGAKIACQRIPELLGGVCLPESLVGRHGVHGNKLGDVGQ